MSRRSIFYIIVGVIALHFVAFVIFSRVNPMPKFRRIPPPPKRNFEYSERVEVDTATGERTIHRDIKVSTKLVPRESLPAGAEREAPNRGSDPAPPGAESGISEARQ